MAEGSVFIEAAEGVFGFGDFIVPELGFDAAEAAELPIGIDEGVGEKAREGRGGLKLLVVAGGDGLQFGRIFAGDDLGFGVDAGFERIEAGDGLPLRRAGAGGVLGVATIRLDLADGSHS